MSSEQFFEVFNQITDDESRIMFMKFAKQYGHNYAMESQPDRIIQYFYHSNYSPEIIANTFLECFGEIIVCREYIYQKEIDRQVNDHFHYYPLNYDYTLIDAMCDHMPHQDRIYDRNSEFYFRVTDLIDAFENIGILHADEYPDNFKELYSLDPKYAEMDYNMYLIYYNTYLYPRETTRAAIRSLLGPRTAV